MKRNFDLNDVYTLEQDDDASPFETAAALQRAINSGSAWSLQGSYGRSMMHAIECGHCMLGRNACFDFYKNRIPARHEVQEGTKGSRSFVASRMGEEWARRIEVV